MSKVQLSITFPLRSLVVLRASFTRPPTQAEIDDGTAEDSDDWQPVDPDGVAARVGKVVDGTMDPATITTHAYLDSPGDIVRDDVGKYHLDFTPPSANVGKQDLNHWAFRFASTGTGQAENEHRFTVAGSEFP